MALTEREEQQVTVLPDGQMEVRTATIIMRDGEDISKTYHRHIVDIGDNLVPESQLVRDIAAGTLHSPERKIARDAVKLSQIDNDSPSK